MMPDYYRFVGRLKQFVAHALDCAQCYGYQKKLVRQAINLPKDPIVLSYGPVVGDELNRGLTLTGGKVKLTYLHRYYPHTKEGFNILYLVSSALPRHSATLVRWAKARGIKVVLNQDGVAYPAWTTDYQCINNELKNIIRCADLVIYQSDFCKEAADQFVGRASAMHTVINNCVDIEKFRQVHRPVADEITLLVAGSHYQRERVIIPLYVNKMLRDRGYSTRLIVAGPLQWTGADDEVELLLKRLQLTEFVEIIGTYSHQDAASLYARGDILLHLKYKDPCPNVVIEAMACGLFVIGSRSGGLPELLGNCGALLPVEESWDEMVYPTVVEVCAAVIEATDTLIARKSAARQRAVTEFSSDSWIETHGHLFRRLLQG